MLAAVTAGPLLLHAAVLFVNLVSPSAQQLPQQLQWNLPSVEEDINDLGGVLPLIFDLQERIDDEDEVTKEISRGMRSAKRTPAPAPDCVCPGAEGAEQRRPAMVDTMTAALREMRDRLDRQIASTDRQHGRDTDLGFTTLSPFRPSGNTQQWRDIMKKIG